MAGSSYTFNFKKLPKAAILTVIGILLIEATCAGLLQVFSRFNENDLIRMDSDPFCRTFSKYAPEAPRHKMSFTRANAQNVKEFIKRGPYDVIVFGSSVTGAGWVEMLRTKFGLKIGALSSIPFFVSSPYPVRACARIIGNYEKLNGDKKAILLYGDILERYHQVGFNGNCIQAFERGISEKEPSAAPVNNISMPSRKTLEYFLTKNNFGTSSSVKIIAINGKEELFYVPDINGLYGNISYNASQYKKICEWLAVLRNSAAKKGCVFAIVIFPTKPQIYEWLVNETLHRNIVSKRVSLRILEKAAIENNIPFLDLEEKLGPIARDLFAKNGEFLWKKCDTHMNDIGNRYTALVIKEFIKEIEKKHY